MTDLPVGWTEEQLDYLIKTSYETRAKKREPFTDDEWRRQKQRFRSSYNLLRSQVIADIEDGDDE